jgi:superfamily II DNA or RNA helicase
LSDIGIVGDIKNNIPEGKTVNFEYASDNGEPSVQLTPNQQTVLSHLMNNVYTDDNASKGRATAVAVVDPGYGKTYIAVGVIKALRRKTFIVVPNTYLMMQWIETLEMCFPESTIGCYYGKRKVDGDIVVSIVNSAIKYTGYDDIGLVIYDEIHEYCSKKISGVFDVAQATYGLGLTATPDERLDKFDPVFNWSVGSNIFANKLPDWNEADINFTSSVTRVIYEGHPDHTKVLTSEAGIVSVPLMVNQIQQDAYRNLLCVASAIKLREQGLFTFIFSDRREHLHVLARVLKECNAEFEAPELEDDKVGMDNKTDNVDGIRELMGGSTLDDIDDAKTRGKIILTTYPYSGTGVSINKMNAVVLATPRKSKMKQIIGRIFRLKSDQTIKRQIVDIVDNRTCLKSQFYKRKKHYVGGLQSPITDIKVKWQDCGSLEQLQGVINFE